MPSDPRRLGPGGPDETRNLIIAGILCVAVLLGYDAFIAGPARMKAAAAQRAAAAVTQQVGPAPGARDAYVDRATALAAGPRALIDNPELDGSIALIGARFDDLSLKHYRQSIAKDAPEVTLLNPQGMKGHYDSYLGWEDPTTDTDVIGARTPWTAAPGARLTPATPLVLTYAGANGLSFTRTIALDDKSLFTITDVVENKSDAPRTLRPVSVVRREGMPLDFIPNQIVHQGLIGVLGPTHDFQDQTYQAAQKFAQNKAKGKTPMDTALLDMDGAGGWLGISDHYWLTAMIPPQGENLKGNFDATPHADYIDFRASYTGASRVVAPGARIEYAQNLFSGAKRVDVLQAYQKQLGAPEFDRAVDWGFFWIMTRPMFWILDHLGTWAGNFGIGILLTTILVKLALFPLVNSSFQAMAKLRKVQPKMKEIQDRFAADKQRQQQEMMKLYQTEKINPVAGCVPILAQIPVFYALYKTLSVTIEMRHAPFFGWIHDLSARDPSNLFNLFGLIPFDPTQLPLVGPFFWLGALPILYGLSMWATQSLSPQATDPTQQAIFRIMPIVFTFMFSSFAAGLVIYWTWSNTLSFLQQYVIMRRSGVETEIDKILKKRFGAKPEAPA